MTVLKSFFELKPCSYNRFNFCSDVYWKVVFAKRNVQQNFKLFYFLADSLDFRF